MLSPSSTLIYSYWIRTTNGLWWCTKFDGRNISGHGCPGYWEGRERIYIPWGESMWRWFRRFCCMGWRRGCWHRTLGGFWVDSTTVWPKVWRHEKLGEVRMEGGCTPLWWKQCRSRGYRRWITTSPATKTHPHSSLQEGILWNFVWKQRGDRGRGWPIHVGNRTAWTCKGCERRLERRNGRRGGEETDRMVPETDYIGWRIL